MPAIENLISFLRLGFIDTRLMRLSWNLKKSRRTYLSYSRLFSLAHSFETVRKRMARSIQVAEFGVGRGGSAILLAWLVNKHQGKITLYDVFSRIPAPTNVDGDKAVGRYEAIINREDENYYGNIDHILELVLNDLHKVCDAERIDIVKGRYEQVLPSASDRKQFDLVHIDCDWYESSVAVYKYLETRLVPGAVIQVDDYSQWEGSKRAFSEMTWLNSYPTQLIDGALVVDTMGTK